MHTHQHARFKERGHHVRGPTSCKTTARGQQAGKTHGGVCSVDSGATGAGHVQPIASQRAICAMTCTMICAMICAMICTMIYTKLQHAHTLFCGRTFQAKELLDRGGDRAQLPLARWLRLLLRGGLVHQDALLYPGADGDGRDADTEPGSGGGTRCLWRGVGSMGMGMGISSQLASSVGRRRAPWMVPTCTARRSTARHGALPASARGSACTTCRPAQLAKHAQPQKGLAWHFFLHGRAAFAVTLPCKVEAAYGTFAVRVGHARLRWRPDHTNKKG